MDRKINKGQRVDFRTVEHHGDVLEINTDRLVNMNVEKLRSLDGEESDVWHHKLLSTKAQKVLSYVDERTPRLCNFLDELQVLLPVSKRGDASERIHRRCALQRITQYKEPF